MPRRLGGRVDRRKHMDSESEADVERSFVPFYIAADEYSMFWQTRYLWSQRIQLVALIGTVVVVGAIESAPYLSVVMLFAVAVSAQLYRFTKRPEERWWDGRAGAESAKTLCWAYIVGGRPFVINTPDPDTFLLRRLECVAAALVPAPPVATDGAHVTAVMRELRSRSLSE